MKHIIVRYLCFLVIGVLLPGILALQPAPSLRVLIFLETECPICQKTTKRVQLLADAYADRVAFEAVYPTETVTKQAVFAFERAYAFRLPHRLDPRHRLVNRYRATTTPEVLLLVGGDRILYRGSVDNQFYKLGRYRQAPTEFYLREAIEAALHGRPVSTSYVVPVGCLINIR